MQEVTSETFDREVTQSNKPVVVDFWGPQCGPCLSLMPKVEALAERYGDKIEIVKVEAPKNRRLCLNLKVMSLPTFLFFQEGKESDRLSGEIAIQSIENSIKKLL
jgi:thioredoxin 1